jgi:hypothetical protein
MVCTGSQEGNKMTIKLYELTDDIRQLEQIENSEEINKALENLNYIFKDKAIHLAKFIMELNAEGTAIDSEVDRLLTRKKTLATKAFYLRTYLQNNMIEAGMEKIDGTIIKLSIRNNPPSCEVKDVMALPEKYRKLIPESWQADRVEILKQFKETGEIIEGATIITGNKRLEIK